MTRAIGVSAVLLFTSVSTAQAACSIAGTSVSFGTYTGAMLAGGAGALSVTCNLFVPYTLSINSGMHTGGGRYNWNMAGPNGALLHYEMFRDAARTQSWGNTQYVDTINQSGNGNAQTINFWPRIPASTLTAPGLYTDTITVSVNSIFGTASAAITVSVNVPASCSISANPLNFGIYSAAQLNATSILNVTCTRTTAYYVNLDNGQHSSCCWTNNMTSAAGAQLGYLLYQDATRSRLWQNTVNYDGQAGTGTGYSQPMTVFGQIWAGQKVAPGLYGDTVVAKVTY